MGTVISVTKQWWLKVIVNLPAFMLWMAQPFRILSRSNIRLTAKITSAGKWIGAGNKVPDKGTTIKVTYCEDKPSKARIEL